MLATDNWANKELMPDPEKLRLLVLMTMVGADSETLDELSKMFEELVAKIGDSGEFSLVESIQPLRAAKVANNQIRRCISTEATPLFVPKEPKHPLSEVCEYIQNNILN